MTTITQAVSGTAVAQEPKRRGRRAAAASAGTFSFYDAISFSGRDHRVHWQAIRLGDRCAEILREKWQAVPEDRNPARRVRGYRWKVGSRSNTGKEAVRAANKFT